MTNSIIIQLQGDANAQQRWVSVDSDSSDASQPQQATLTELREVCHNQTVIVLLPADEVLLLTAQLPVMKKNRLLQALPFALEDQLSDVPTAYHFTVLGQQTDAGAVHVAAIEKNRLQAWHDLLHQHHIVAHEFIPTLLAVPHTGHGLTVLLEDQHALVRFGQYQGFMTSKDNLATLLPAYLTEIDAPDHIQVLDYTTQSDSIDFETLLEQSVTVDKRPNETCLTDLAHTALKHSDCNVLTGKFFVKRKHQVVKRYWRLSFIFLALIIVIAVINTIVQYTVYSAENHTLTKQIDQLYKQNFPNSTAIVAPKERLQSKLQDLNSFANGNPFLALLAQAGFILKNTEVVQIHTIQFQDQQLLLTVSSNNFANLDTVINQLKAKQLQVTQRNARTVGKSVTTVLAIKEAR